MNRRSTFTRATAVVALAFGLITVGHTPGFAPLPAEAALSVNVPTDVEKPAAGDGFLCAVVSADYTSSVMCSGKNTVGQLGDNTTTNRNYLMPVNDSSKLGSAHQLVAGKSHACALAGYGSTPPGDQYLYCWGDNQYGQLGTGNFTNSSVPVLVADNGSFTNSGIIGVIAGYNHTCAVKIVSSVYKLFCWGLNNKGQLGDTTTSNSNLPTPVAGVFSSTGVFSAGVRSKQAIAAGAEHTCATQVSTFTVYCWGENGDGQLGNNSRTDSSTPVSTSMQATSAGGTYNSQIAAGLDFTCARHDSGDIRCWGDNTVGQMGNGLSADLLIPTAVPNNAGFQATGVQTIVAGGQTVCVQDSDSSKIIWCWGANNAGQVGDNTLVNKNRPTRLLDNSAASFTNGLLGGFNNNHRGMAVSNSVSDGFSCLTVWCWGGNATGQLAQNNTTALTLPTKLKYGTVTSDDVTGAAATATYTANGVVVTFTGVPASGLSYVSITVAPTTQRLAPNQPGGFGTPMYAARTYSGGTLPTVSGNSFSVTVPRMTIETSSMSGPPTQSSASFEPTGSYHLIYTINGSSTSGYPDGWRIRKGLTTGDTVTVTGTTPAAATTTKTTAAPTTTTTAAPVASRVAGTTSTGSYATAIPGVTVTDPTVYTSAPVKVADNSAISVLTPAQASTMDIKTLTPSVCLPNDEDLVFIDQGRCIAQVVNAKTRAVLRTLKTTVIGDDIADLKVGNEVAVLAPLYFHAGTANFKASSIARLKKLKTRIEAAGSVLVAGHTGNLMGNTPENVTLSKQRAQATVAALKARGSDGPFAIAAIGALDPVNNGDSRAEQDKNRRSVIVLIP